MKKRIIALLLAAALTLGGLVLPASAEASGRLRDFRRAGLTKAASMGDCYVYPAAWTFDATTVKGETVVLAFKRNKPTPRADDVFFVNIYSGTADDLMESADDPEPEARFPRELPRDLEERVSALSREMDELFWNRKK